MKEAEAIEQQMRAKGGSVPPSGGPQVLFWSYVQCRFFNLNLSVWWTASIWWSAPVWRSTSRRTAVLLSRLLSLEGDHTTGFQVRFIWQFLCLSVPTPSTLPHSESVQVWDFCPRNTYCLMSSQIMHTCIVFTRFITSIFLKLVTSFDEFQSTASFVTTTIAISIVVPIYSDY